MKLLAFLAVTMIGAQASALELSNKFGLGGGLGLSIPTNSQFVKDNAAESMNGSLWLRHHFNNKWNFEIAYDRLELGGTDARVDHFNLLVGYRFFESNFSPLVGLGIGMGNVTDLVSDGDYSGFSAKARAGFDWFFCEDKWSTGLNVDFHYTNARGQQANEVFILSPLLSLTYYFSADSSPKKIAPVTTHHEVKKVKDSDNDGISDAMDKCPSSKTGDKVNSFGCSEKEKYEVTLDVKFASGKTNVESKYHDQLKAVADFLKEFPSATAEIQGHTDNTGKLSSNMYFSRKRAEGVRMYIIKNFGIEASRLTAKGYGPNQPVADNSTSEGRATNRRVVAKMSSK